MDNRYGMGRIDALAAVQKALDMDGTLENLNTEAANVYPNPSTDGFNVACEDMTEVAVYAMDGKLVKRIAAEGQCNIEGLNEGVYVLRIALRSGGEIMQKIVKY